MDVYENEVGRDEARQQLGLSASTRVALFIGRLLPYKGIEELVQGVFRNWFGRYSASYCRFLF